MKIKKMLCMLAVAAIAPISALAALPAMWEQVPMTPKSDEVMGFYINKDTLRYDEKSDTATADVRIIKKDNSVDRTMSYIIDFRNAKVRATDMFDVKNGKAINVNKYSESKWHAPLAYSEPYMYEAVERMTNRKQIIADTEKKEKDEQAAKNRKDNLNKGLNVLGGILRI